MQPFIMRITKRINFLVLTNLYLLVLKVIAVELPNVQSPPTMIKQPQSEQLFQVSQTQDEPDKPFMLECEAFGNPEVKYKWHKNNQLFEYVPYDDRISQQPQRGTLVFTKPDVHDEGLYQCFAENSHGVSVSNAVFLKKSEIASFPDVDPKQVHVIEGQPLTLDCNPPSGYPKPKIFWLVQSSTGALRTINSSRITVDPEGDLHFSSVTASDSLHDAMYACSATSFFRTEYKLGNRVILEIEPPSNSGQASYPPTKQYTSPPSISVLRGQELEMNCIYGGTPLPEIVWKKKGGDLQSGHHTYLNYGKTLKISNVQFSDASTYECTASNGVGIPLSHAMTVEVESSPYWITSPSNTIAANGESVTFQCKADGRPEPKLKWFRNGMPLEELPPNDRRRLEGDTLILKNLLNTDTAVFQCNASNAHGYAFKDFYLNVLAVPPTIIEQPDPLTRAVVTSVVILRCRVFGAPRPDVKWKREGKELTGGRYQVLDNGDLQITDVLVTDQGDFTCYASNKYGFKEAVGHLEVKGKTKITQPPENFEVAAGRSATFRCNAEADPNLKLNIDWYFNGQQVDFDQDPRMVKASDNSLTITKTIELDSGIYTCMAKTELDKDEAKATLTVQDTPNAPKIISVLCDHLIALVKWQPMGDRRAPILSYTIQYNTSFTPDTWEDSFANIPAPDTKFKVHMSPWANYTFRVIARNKIGPSLPSGSSQRCTTSDDVPNKNPDNVVGRGTRPTNLVISWTPMPLIEQNAPGFFYKVFYKRDDIPSIWSTRLITDWEQSQLILDSQPTFVPFRIKVEAHNRRGQANVAASEIIGYSGEDYPTEAPQNFKLLDSTNARSAVFSWDPVSPSSVNGHFRGYKIQTWTVNEGEDRLREMVVANNVTRALVAIFRPNSRNSVRVLVYNDMYNGPYSDTIEITTPEGTPGPVASFDAIPMGSSAFYLMWKRPLEPNGNLMGYRIYYQEVDGTALGINLERQPPITNSRETRAKLAGLKPSTKYRIIIRATTSKGQGAPYYIEVKTNNEAQHAPDVPKFNLSRLPDDEGKAGVKVTWIPAVDGHPGSYFYVQYKKRGQADWESTPMEENQDSVAVQGLELGTLYEMRVIAVDGGHETPSAVKEIETGGLALTAPGSTSNAATAAWFIGMMCAIALLLKLLILVCLIKRNRGGKYSVHEKEASQGHDLDYPDDGGFNEYNKPMETQTLPRGSHTSLTSSLKGAESDTDSMADYGEGEMGKFGEDGSFIGQYGERKKKEGEATSPSALATFV